MAARIRRATRADADAIGAVHVQSWQAAYRGRIADRVLDALDAAERARMWRGALDQPELDIWVAEEGDRVIGFLCLAPARSADGDPARVAEVRTVYLLPDCWRKGIGRRLLARAFERARERGFEELALWVLETNEAARAFYGTMGMRPDGGRRVDELGGEALPELRYRVRL